MTVAIVTIPTWIVQLDHAAVADAPDWQDITSSVRSWSSSGPTRRRLTERFNPGTATFDLDNSTGDFTPSNTGGAHYPNLKPMRRIRAGWTWTDDVEGVVTQWEFTGHVDGWPRSFTSRNSDTMTVTATDGSKRLQRTELVGVWLTEVAAASPVMWWRLGESSGTAAEDASGNDRPGTYAGGATFYSRAGLIIDDDDTAISLEGLEVTPAVYVWRNENPIAGAADFTIGWWMSHDYDQSAEIQPRPLAYGGNDTLGYWRVWSRSGDSGLGFMTGDGTLGATLVSYTTGINDGEPHFVVFRRSAGTLEIFVDGTSVASVGGSTQTLAAGPTLLGVGDPLGLLGGLPGVVYDEFVMWDSALSDVTIAEMYAAGSTPWGEDLPGERAANVLDMVGVAAGDRDLDPGRSVMTDARTDGRKAWDALLECGDAEGIGAVYVNGDGQVVLVDRDTMWTDERWTTSQATFGPNDVPYIAPFAIDFTDQDIATRAVTSRTGGTQIVKDDAAAQDEYGILDVSKTGMPVVDDDVPESLASLLLDELAEPAEAAPAMTLAPGDDLTIWAQALERRIGDRVTVEPVDGSASIEAAVYGKSWKVDGLLVRCTLTLGRPLKGVWILGDGVLGDTTRLGY